MEQSRSEEYIGGLKKIKRENERKYLNNCLENAEKIGNLLVKRDSSFDKVIMRKYKKELESGEYIDSVRFNIASKDIPEYKSELSLLDECYNKYHYGTENDNLTARLNKSNVFRVSQAIKMNTKVNRTIYIPGIYLSFYHWDYLSNK